MDAKAYGKIAGLILWPGLACLSLWLVSGGMPPAIEKVLVYLLWILAGTLLFIVFGSAVVSIFYSHAQARPAKTDRLDRVFFYIVTPSRVVLILALFLADRPILGGCFLVGFVSFWVLKMYTSKRLTQSSSGTHSGHSTE